MSAGNNHACAITAAGRIVCWGADSYSKATPPLGRFRSVAAGVNHTCGVRADGTPMCWGRDDLGQTAVPANFG